VKLLLTKELGRLAKWLRILGFDAEYSQESNPASLIIQALREERIILSRNHRLPVSRGLKIIILKEEKIREQLREALKILGIEPNGQIMFTRCTICNLELAPIAKEKVRGKVPDYVFQTQESFFICPKCSRIYWHGTHWGNASSIIKELNG